MSVAGPANRPETIIYDLDGVITRKDTFAALVFQCFRKRPRLLIRALPSMVAMLFSREASRKERAAQRVVKAALSGIDASDYAARARSLGIRIGGSPAWMRAEIVHRMRSQHRQGRKIVVATATERQLAQALLARAEIPYDMLSASLLMETKSGLMMADHRVGARKADALREQSVRVGMAEFVTDSLADLPTAREAALVKLIGASSMTRRGFTRAGVQLSKDRV